MHRVSVPISAVFAILLVALSPAQGADALAAIQGFSGFKKVDLEKLAQGEIEGNRIPAEGSDLTISVEALFAVPLSPERVVRLMEDSEAATTSQASETLDLEGHYPVKVPASEADFAMLDLSTDDGPGKTMLKNSRSGSGLNLSAVEAAQLARSEDPKVLAAAWRSILTNRAKTFQTRGWVGSPAYDNGGRGFNLHQEMVRMLKSKPDILERFKDSIGPTMTGKLAEGMSTPVYYWESSRIQGDRTFTLAAVFSRKLPGGVYQVVEPTYYVSSKYFASLILYEIHPVTIQGKPHSLVWRGDLVITPSMNFMKGVERMAAENITLLEVRKSVKSFSEECRAAAR